VHHVPAAARLDPFRAELAPQAGHGALEDLRRGLRRRLAPELVDQAVARHELVRVEQEQGEQSAVVAGADRDRPFAVDDLERAEDPELHSTFSCVLTVTLRRAHVGERRSRSALPNP
jgi:hypothetical protein